MYKSRFSDTQKQDIVNERINSDLSVREICDKYNITVQTFYIWQRKFFGSSVERTEIPGIEDVQNSPEAENRLLRRLYIDLSAHNYKLAKFLDK